jgi:hypothetical protein
MNTGIVVAALLVVGYLLYQKLPGQSVAAPNQPSNQPPPSSPAPTQGPAGSAGGFTSKGSGDANAIISTVGAGMNVLSQGLDIFSRISSMWSSSPGDVPSSPAVPAYQLGI